MKIQRFWATKGLLFFVLLSFLALPTLLRQNPNRPVDIPVSVPTNSSGKPLFSGLPVYLEMQRLSDVLKQNPDSYLFRVLWDGRRQMEYNRKTHILRVSNAENERWCSYYLYSGVTDENIHKVAHVSGLPAMLKKFGCNEKVYISTSDCP